MLLACLKATIQAKHCLLGSQCTCFPFTVVLSAHSIATDLYINIDVLIAGVKQLEKLIRKRLEEKRKDKAMRKALQKSEELAKGN